MTPAPSTRPHYGNLEALRGIAALVVVLHHLSLRPGTLLSGNPWLTQGWLFVDLFFVLSGFVIASVHAAAPATGIAATGFLIRRFFRLWPLHLATLLAALALDLAGPVGALPGYGWMLALNLAMVHGWGFVPGAVLNGPSWSISVEWAAYLLFAGLCLIVPHRRARIGAMALVGMASLAVLLVWRGGSLDGDMTLRLPRCLMSFALGSVLWHGLDGRSALRPAAAAGGQLAVVAAMLAIVPLSRLWPPLALAMPLLSAAMIALMVRDPGSAARRLLARPVPQWLGRHSYSLYLVHMPLFHALAWAGANRLPGDVWLALCLPMLLVVSALTYRWIEAPWRDRGRALARQAERSAALRGQALQLV